MENLQLIIVTEEGIFNGAIEFLNQLQNDNLITNEEVLDYMNQMLNNPVSKEVDEEDNKVFVVMELNFKDELNVNVICAFWNALCAETREDMPDLYEIGFDMYYGLVMALEQEKAERDI